VNAFAALSSINGNPAQAEMRWANMSGWLPTFGRRLHRPPIPNCRRPRAPCSAGCWGAPSKAFDGTGPAARHRRRSAKLVCTEPLPSMPLRFWNDDGERPPLSRQLFSRPIPNNFDGTGRGARSGVHGDWLKIGADGHLHDLRPQRTRPSTGTALRMGTSELYFRDRRPCRKVLDFDGRGPFEYLGPRKATCRLVRGVCATGVTLDRAMQVAGSMLRSRRSLSRRFLPNEIIAVFPRFHERLSGKEAGNCRSTKLLLGQPLEKVINKDAMANPGCLDWYLAFARDRLQQSVTAIRGSQRLNSPLFTERPIAVR